MQPITLRTLSNTILNIDRKLFFENTAKQKAFAYMTEDMHKKRQNQENIEIGQRQEYKKVIATI